MGRHGRGGFHLTGVLALAVMLPVMTLAATVHVLAQGTWTSTGSLATARLAQTATLLDGPACAGGSPPSYCGRVLVMGGFSGGTNSSVLGSTEVFDPAAGTWTAGAACNPRAYHSATLLSTGRVLLAGGLGTAGVPQASADLYDPATGTCAATGAMSIPRSFHTATALAGGKVMVAGGRVSGLAEFLATATSTAELYDPASGTWSLTGPMLTARSVHTATLLAGPACSAPSPPMYCGRVLVAGGIQSSQAPLLDQTPTASSELYDPLSGSWCSAPAAAAATALCAGPLATARDAHTASLLPSTGEVLVAGGDINAPNPPFFTATAELYDPATGRWSATGSLTTTRGNHTASVLNPPVCAQATHPSYCFKVLAAGGETNSVPPPPPKNTLTTVPLASAELYDPAVGTWTATGSLSNSRFLFSATLLTGGSTGACASASPPSYCGHVVAVGGSYSRGNQALNVNVRATAELYAP